MFESKISLYSSKNVIGSEKNISQEKNEKRINSRKVKGLSLPFAPEIFM